MKTSSLKFPSFYTRKKVAPQSAQLQTQRPISERHSISQIVRLLDMINLAKKQYPPLKDETL